MAAPVGKINNVLVPPTTNEVGRSQPAARTESGGNLTFSKHLADRINRRRLDLSGEKMNRLTQAVDKVADKGAQDSVVFLDDLALLVNVPSRTVKTAIETAKMREGVFTNIDSVVLG